MSLDLGYEKYRDTKLDRSRREAALDETIDSSFPASDPQSTVPNPDSDAEKVLENA